MKIAYVKFSEIPDAELKTIINCAQDARDAGCFGTSDLLNQIGATHELNKRGYKIIKKRGELKYIKTQRRLNETE